MTSEASDGPDADAITRYITETYPDTVIAHAEGATFFSLDESHWPNFATIVTGEAFDDGSNLSRPGVFRLNSVRSRGRRSSAWWATSRTRTSPSWTGCSPTRSTPSSAGSRS